MPLSQPQAIDALRNVREPELRRSIVELGLVSAVEVGRGDRVSVSLLTKVEDDPVDDELVEAVRGALGRAGASRVEVTVAPLEVEDQRLLLARLRAGWSAHENAGQPGHGHAAGPGEAPPFMQAGSKTRILGISSGKGGVGKSSTTVNLAIALAQRGLDVGIIDADIYGFSVPKMLGIDRQPSMIPDSRAEERELRMIVPPVAHGVAAMSMGFLVEDERAIVWRGPMIHKAIEQFLTDVYWGEPDFLLIDMPPGTGDVALSMSQFLPRSELFVVTTPQPAAQRVAQRSATMARLPQVNMVVQGVIENMTWFTGDDGTRYEIFGAGGGSQLAADLGVPLVGQIPLVPELREGMDHGAPIMVTDPQSEAGRAYATIAEKIVVELGPKRRYNKALRIS